MSMRYQTDHAAKQALELGSEQASFGDINHKPSSRRLMSRETFETRVNEMIALIRAEECLSPGMRRCLWLRLFDLADKFNAMTAAGASAPE